MRLFVAIEITPEIRERICKACAWLGVEVDGEANARQVVTRARQHVANGRRMPANATEHRRLLDAFVAAATHGDVAGLEGTLCAGRRPVRTPPRVPSAHIGLVDGSLVRDQRAAA